MLNLEGLSIAKIHIACKSAKHDAKWVELLNELAGVTEDDSDDVANSKLRAILQEYDNNFKYLQDTEDLALIQQLYNFIDFGGFLPSELVGVAQDIKVLLPSEVAKKAYEGKYLV